MSRPEPPSLEEPWQAEALALSMALVQAGRVSAAEWAAGLGSAIKRAQATGDPDDGSTYYHHVLDALEALAFEKALTTRDALAARKEAWRVAYANTPHGQPIQLPRPASPTGASEGSASSLLAGWRPTSVAAS